MIGPGVAETCHHRSPNKTVGRAERSEPRHLTVHQEEPSGNAIERPKAGVRGDHHIIGAA
ncbi:MAG: hypothetical protein Fues2KO_37540 [Fuerstiella sp.]